MIRHLTSCILLLTCWAQLSAQAPPATPANIATGIIRDENDVELPGAVVRLQNDANGFDHSASTDRRGIFTFRNVPAAAGYRFVISYINHDNDTLSGYEMKEGGRISLSITLHSKQSTLDKVVVVGYGTMRKRDLSAAVSEVPDMQQIKERPVVDVANMIQGKVPGVTVVSDGGHPDRTPSVTIRGVGSRNAEEVLYVVDGVPNAPYNPADVTSITILKDAASSAIYGAFSGSAGVILITTRQAGQGKPGVEYTAFAGAKTAWRLPQSLPAATQAQVANIAYANAGLTPLDGWNASLNPYDQVTRTDWVHSIFRTGLVHRHNIAINAGTDKFSTLFEGRYEENEGTLLNTYAKNISGRFNASYQFDPHVRFKQEVFVNSNDNRGTQTSSGYDGVILSAIYMPRSATVYYPDGTFGGTGPRNSPYLGIHGDAINPVATLLRNQAYNRTLDLQSVSELKVSNVLTPGLSLLSRFSYRQSNLLNKTFQPERTEPGKPVLYNQLSYTSDRSWNWIWENTINYNHTFGRHSIGAMASTTAQDVGDMYFYAAAKTFDNEATWAQFFVNAANFTDIRPQDGQLDDRNLSYVGRLSYSWADRYFLTGSYRYDMADRLPIQHRGKGFPAATAAWKISSEPFFSIPSIDLFKLRASWGRIGNIGSVKTYYGYPTLASDYTYQVGNGGPMTPGLYIDSLYNPNLSWETSEQKDFGADISVLNQRLNFTFDYFNKLTFDLIQPQSNNWPNTMGLNPPLINQGKIRNMGFEFAVSWKGNIGKVGYELGANAATLNNKVEYIDGNPKSAWQHSDAWRGTLAPYRSTVGQPYYSYWLIRTAGIFQSDAAAAAYVDKSGNRIQPNAKAGDLKFVDVDGNGKIDDNDRVYMGNAFPKFTYGFTANFTWNRFDLSLFLQGVGGVKLFHAFKESTLNGSEQGYDRWNKILDAWSPTNPKGSIPRISASDPNNNFQTASDWYLESGNYLRLKSLIIGYTFPHLIRNNSLRVYFSGDNLVTLTKYSGMDPEVGGIGLDGGQFPVSRTFAIGVKLNY
ncbi:MAG TPA: SusC/RagA family TonB-linked outer membrane protein [Puia sp.]|uniref:SusC/RagA family TonB-linked outer membrane protein n=1 Tax=Puia sp. TaxID=2045100 RepID=UPI002B84C4DA|nr:SusC/RagA family TonB-linked outer membrane protein [Puia sp.]HVU95371.1 SusC/RagA family TonB-linked outer membrane protein [Puia sp.]